MYPHEKEIALQEHVMETRLGNLNAGNEAECRELVKYAAKVARDVFGMNRFGCFEGGAFCIVYSNMGEQHRYIRDQLLQTLDDDALAVGLVPERSVVLDSRTAFDAWAVLIDDCDGQKWCDFIKQVYVHNGTVGDDPPSPTRM